MTDKFKNRAKFLGVLLVLLWFGPQQISAQETLSGTSEDKLLEQYLFPISSFLESGNPIEKPVPSVIISILPTIARRKPGNWEQLVRL